MKIRQIVSGAALALIATTLVSSTLEAQQRVRVRENDGERRAFTLYNGLLRGFGDRGRLGVYVDRHQPTRYDERGARLTGVSQDSPAWEAGLQEGDIVTSINGQSLTSALASDLEDEFDRDESMPAQRLTAIAADLEPGDDVDVDYIRNGEAESVSFEAEELGNTWITSGSAPQVAFDWNTDGNRVEMREHLQELTGQARLMGERARGRSESLVLDMQGGTLWNNARMDGQCPSGSHSFMDANAGCLAGTEIREIESELGAYFNVEAGLLIVDAAPDNRFELEAGDVIIKIDDREVTSFRRLRRLIGSYEKGETITLTVMRDGGEVELETELD